MAELPDWGADTYGAEANAPQKPVAARKQSAKPASNIYPGSRGATRKQMSQGLSANENKLAYDGMAKGYKVPKSVKHAQEDRILGSAQAASMSEYREGVSWYPRARKQAENIASDYADPKVPTEENVRRASDTIARLSPSGGGMNWERNVPAARDIYRMDESSADAISRGNRSGVAGSNLRFASNQDIGTAHSLSRGHVGTDEGLGRVKVRHFADNIYTGGAGDATIDGRAYDIAHGTRHGWGTDLGLGNEQRYQHVADRYHNAARMAGTSDSGMQATTWTTDKRHAVEAGAGTVVNQDTGNRSAGFGASHRDSSKITAKPEFNGRTLINHIAHREAGEAGRQTYDVGTHEQTGATPQMSRHQHLKAVEHATIMKHKFGMTDY